MSIPSTCLLCAANGCYDPTPVPCPHDLKIGAMMITPEKYINVRNISDEVLAEVLRATAAYKPLNSPHEASAVIREEFEEFWDEVKDYNLRKGRDTRPRMREELIQLAAMAIRAITDVIDNGKPDGETL